MFGKRTYCILGTMLLAVATLGSGVSAEQSNERLYDLEELGILELSMDDGVVEAMITSESFLSFMNSDDAALLAIESIAMNVGLSDDGELELTEIDINVGEEQSNEIAVTLRLSDDLLELLHDEDLSSEDLLRELGFGDDLGLDDFNPEVADDYWHSRTYWADEAYQVRGSQADYDAVMDSEDPEEEFYNIYEEVMSDWEEEEEFDDSYVEISEADTRNFFHLRDLVDKKVAEYGLYMRDHEVRKNLMLETIENARANSEDVVRVLREKYDLDPKAEYTMEINQDGSGNIVFVKR